MRTQEQSLMRTLYCTLHFQDRVLLNSVKCKTEPPRNRPQYNTGGTTKWLYMLSQRVAIPGTGVRIVQTTQRLAISLARATADRPAVNSVTSAWPKKSPATAGPN